MQVSVDYIIASNMVKYRRLKELIHHVYNESDADNINIYIDLYPIFRSIYSNTYQVILSNTIDIAAGIINMCAHYRDFFRGFGVESKIYLVGGFNCPKINNNYIHDYNRAMANRISSSYGLTLNSALRTNIEMLKKLCPYLPDIFYIHTYFETSVAISGMIMENKRNGNTDPNLVISKDSYPLQLVLMDQSIAYLRPKKVNNSDVSYIIKTPIAKIDKEIFWNTYFNDRKTVAKPAYDIDPLNVSLLSALSGYPQRSVRYLTPINKAMDMIAAVVGDQPIKCSVKSLSKANEKFLMKRNIGDDLILSRFHALDVQFQLEAFYSHSAELKSMIFENLIDPVALNKINSEFFSDNPLDLNRL